MIFYPGSRVVLDNVVSNIGDHYWPLHGYFRCPFDGLYVFSVTTHTPYPLLESEQCSSSRLMYDGEVVVYGPLTYVATSTHDSGSASITVVLECQQGKDVYVEAHDTYTFLGNAYGAVDLFYGFLSQQ